MLVTGLDIIVFAAAALPNTERSLVLAHYIDGDSVPVLVRRYGIKRPEIEHRLDAALATMRAALRSRGVRGVDDVI